MALNKRDQMLVVFMGVALACVAIWYFWLQPTTVAITTANQKATTLNNEKTTISNRIKFIDATSKDLATNPDGQKLLTLAAPNGAGIDNLLVSLNAMAVSSGVSMTSVQPQTSSTTANTFSVTINVSGTFPAVQAFVSALEQNERPITISSMSLSSAASSQGSTVIAATMNLSALQASTAPASASGSAK